MNKIYKVVQMIAHKEYPLAVHIIMIVLLNIALFTYIEVVA